jgi:hypothetical protein
MLLSFYNFEKLYIFVISIIFYRSCEKKSYEINGYSLQMRTFNEKLPASCTAPTTSCRDGAHNCDGGRRKQQVAAAQRPSVTSLRATVTEEHRFGL